MCVCMGEREREPKDARRWHWTLDPKEVELQVIVSQQTWVIGTEHGSSGRSLFLFFIAKTKH